MKERDICLYQRGSHRCTNCLCMSSLSRRGTDVHLPHCSHCSLEAQSTTRSSWYLLIAAYSAASLPPPFWPTRLSSTSRVR
jgi:hypothetical protein